MAQESCPLLSSVDRICGDDDEAPAPNEPESATRDIPAGSELSGRLSFAGVFLPRRPQGEGKLVRTRQPHRRL